MTFTWLRLLFAAPLLLSAASSQYVSVKCNDTEEGQLVTIHCTYTLPQNCPIETTKTHVPVLLGIFVPVIALGIFGALFGKKIINRINKATPQDNNPDMERAVLHDNKELQELVLKPGNESAFLHFLFPCVRG
ncbi:hypothetical protein JOQ06_022428 [Pogonophryne albipinna]|uniref:Uncharacterized protein n=1 Tax=Pogonophryne albipinna TaxID=1090488 RepID=A0AAD6F5I6_9TELE|nr:hypothetical protein JOQ06_022428 [Pogonophryne albipinna]